MAKRFPQRYIDEAFVVTLRDDEEQKPPSAQRSFQQSVRCAWDGVCYAVKTQRNLRIHLVVSVQALALGSVLRLSLYEVALVFTLCALVMFAELMNTALELTLDHHVGTAFDPSVKLIKDVAAGAVLIVALAAAVVGAAVFVPSLSFFFATPPHAPILAWFLVCGALTLPVAVATAIWAYVGHPPMRSPRPRGRATAWQLGSWLYRQQKQDPGSAGPGLRWTHQIAPTFVTAGVLIIGVALLAFILGLSR